jgi:hypothetical protein
MGRALLVVRAQQRGFARFARDDGLRAGIARRHRCHAGQACCQGPTAERRFTRAPKAVAIADGGCCCVTTFPRCPSEIELAELVSNKSGLFDNNKWSN